MKEYQDKRERLVKNYENGVRDLERFKGSRGYNEDLKKLTDKFEDDRKKLIEEYAPGINASLGGMLDAIGKRTVEAPTTEQVNLLNVLKMKRRVTLEELQRVAETVKGNPIALSLVTEIAQDHGIIHSFEDLNPEMSSSAASEIVQTLKDSVGDFLNYDTSKAARLAKDYHERFYGATDQELPKRETFEDKEGCFRQLCGLEGDSLKVFCEIADGEAV
jgi:hypothetical protein